MKQQAIKPMGYVQPLCCLSEFELEWLLLDSSFSAGHEDIDDLQNGDFWDILP